MSNVEEQRSRYVAKPSQSLEMTVYLYTKLLQRIATAIEKKQNVENNKKKFSSIKRDLYDFMQSHKDFFKLFQFQLCLSDNTS